MALNADEACNYSWRKLGEPVDWGPSTDPLTTLAASCGNCRAQREVELHPEGRSGLVALARLPAGMANSRPGCRFFPSLHEIRDLASNLPLVYFWILDGAAMTH